MAHTKHTFCRICEPECPLIAAFDDDGQISGLSPDRAHPTQGVACHKGLSFLDVHNDPDRVNWPQRRLNPRTEARGNFVEVGWDDAIADIAARTTQLRETYGPNSVAVYMGNPYGFNFAGLMALSQFQDVLGTQMRFGANTQDTWNKMIAAGAMYGSTESLMIPDLAHTDYLLVAGSNPKVSRWTFMSIPNNWEIVKDIPRRGGKVRFLNPRKTESSTEDTGPTILIRPGTDVYFFAAVLNEILTRQRVTESAVERFGKNLGELATFVKRYPAERVAGVTGVPVHVIKEVASDLLAAKSASVYMATGVNLSRQGTLCYWLAEMINFITGNLGRKGGMFKPSGLFESFSPLVGFTDVKTSLGVFRLTDPVGFSLLPGASLPDLIEAGDIRALFALGGNPLLSIGGGERARRAYEKLDLLVAVDIFRSATGEMCDYVLPATDWLERPDINHVGITSQFIPYVQYTPVTLEPTAGRRNEWWILAKLQQAMGLESPLTLFPDETSGSYVTNGLLGIRDLSIEKLLALPSHTAVFPQASYDSLFDRCMKHKDGKVDCYPDLFVTSGLISRCEDIFEEHRSRGSSGLSLISLRTPYLHNSWLGNSQQYRRGKNAENPLHMTEHDASILGLFAGDAVRVSTDFGKIDTRILIDDDLCQGTVAMSHGSGQERSYSLTIAQKNPGANCNSLMPIGEGSYEPMSYMSWLSGVPVSVERIAHE